MLVRLVHFEQGKPFQLPFDADSQKTFKAFLQKMWQNKRWRVPFEKANVPLSPFFKWNGAWVTPQNYVGFIKYQDYVIELYPKLFAQNSPSRTLMWKHLFFYLGYAQPNQYAWDFVQGTAEALPSAWEFYQMMCLAQIKDYLSEEIYQSYEPTTALLPHLRGRLAVQPYLQQALSKGKWQQLAVSYAPLVVDNPLNQLLKFVLGQWQVEAKGDTIIYQQLSGLLQKLGNISTRYFTLEEALAIRLPSFANTARQILEICIYFLENQVASMGKEPHQNFAWLLPMERVYERFIFGFLEKHFPQLKIQWQSSAYLATSFATQQPALRVQPDMYLPDVPKILDAKYKLLPKANAAQNPHILPEDVYQMLAYCIAKQCREACLLYPASFEAMPDAPQSFQIPISSDKDDFITLKTFVLPITEAKEDTTWQTTLTAKLIKQLEAILY